MVAMLSQNAFDLVVDATHPYAEVVTENIAAACAETGTEYLRLLRDNGSTAEKAVFVSDVAEAVKFLNGVEGNILLTTGSKELSKFSVLDGFKERVYARVLPMEESLQLCKGAGLARPHSGACRAILR